MSSLRHRVDASEYPNALSKRMRQKLREFVAFARIYKLKNITLWPADYDAIAYDLRGSGFPVERGLKAGDVSLERLDP